MKIKICHLRLTGSFENGNGENKELDKLLFHGDRTIMKQILKYIRNDLTTDQIRKFIAVKSFEKTFMDKTHFCTLRFHFSPYGDLSLEVIKFGRRDMYKEMKQQRIRNFSDGIFDDDVSF